MLYSLKKVMSHEEDDAVRALRKRERALHDRGLARAPTQIANLALRCGIPVEHGPQIPGNQTDRGLYVPVWFHWYLERFPQNEINTRQRLEDVRHFSADKEKQLILLIEANLVDGMLYDPAGDIATKAALTLLEAEINKAPST